MRGGRAGLSDEWPVEDFQKELASRDRVVVLYHADWCPFSRAFLPSFEAAEPESSVPLARTNLHHPQDPRWDDARVHVVPTLVYYEHGEELERVEAKRGRGLDLGEFEQFMETVEDLQEKWRVLRGRLRPDRFG